MDGPDSAMATEPIDHARRDLVEVVQTVLARDGAIFTAGERVVCQRLLDAEEPTGSLYARLLSRVPRVFWLDELSYAEIPDIAGAARALVELGLALDAAALAPTPWLAEARTVPVLKAAAASLGRPVGGRRADLVARMSDAEARPALVAPSLVLLHRGLMRRIARLYLHDSHGDLSRIIVARLGVVRMPTYTPSGGPGIFPSRGALLGWEEALSRRALLDELGESALIADGDRAMQAVESTPSPPDWRRRFSARRHDEAIAFGAAQRLAANGKHEEAAGLLRRLLDAGVAAEAEVGHRLALTLERLERADEGARLCQRLRDRPETAPELVLSLDRSGRRLAKKAGQPWIPLPPLSVAPVREVPLAAAGSGGARPVWQSRGGPTTIEAALIDALGAANRASLHGENEIWTTLFGLLFADVLFADVPGLLPTHLLSGPLDLGSPGFAARRRPLIEQTLAEIALGGAPSRLERVIAEREGEAIIGVRWELNAGQLLQNIARELPGPALAAVMRCFAEDWRGAASGLPDLVVLPGPQTRIEGALPATLPAELLFIEVKGPTDSLRDGQRVWHDRLLRAGLRVELWRVVAR